MLAFTLQWFRDRVSFDHSDFWFLVHNGIHSCLGLRLRQAYVAKYYIGSVLTPEFGARLHLHVVVRVKANYQIDNPLRVAASELLRLVNFDPFGSNPIGMILDPYRSSDAERVV